MLRLAADEHVNGDIVRGLLRRNPQVDIVRVQDVGLSSARTIGAMNGSLGSTELVLSDIDAWIRRRFAPSHSHVDALIVRAGGEVVTLASTGTPLGLMPPGLLPFAEQQLTLETGDTLVLFSDGVPEAQNRDDEEYGEARLIECLRGAGDQGSAALIERIMASIDTFAGDAPQYDDITLMIVRRI